MEYNFNEKNQQWLEITYEKIISKISAECDRIGSKIPYIAEDGKYQEDKAETDIVWWTNGFWSGILWQLYHATQDEKYKQAAVGVENKLDRALEQYTGLHHDVGFMWLHSAIANYRLTQNERSLARGLHAAHLLAGRYNPRGKFIRSWNRDRVGWVIIDSMMNIPMLYWAADTIGDPRFRYIAMDHADNLMTHMVRSDGSCNHIIVFNPENGDVLDNPGGQGYATGSSWSRGQAWGIYGFALSYHHTKKLEYLATAKKIAHYFLANIAETDDIACVDFRAPAEPVYWDSTAGVCAACGMLEIAKHVPELERKFYVNGALRILQATDQKCCDWNLASDAIVGLGTGSYKSELDRHVPIIYGDYFFIEAVMRLMNKDVLLW